LLLNARVNIKAFSDEIVFFRKPSSCVEDIMNTVTVAHFTAPEISTTFVLRGTGSISRKTGSCRRSAWSTFPPLCSDQSSAGAAREAVYRRRPGLSSRRTHRLVQPAGRHNSISAPSLSIFSQRLKTVPGLVP